MKREEREAPATKNTGRGIVLRGNVALASNGTTVTGVQNHPECLIDGIGDFVAQGLKDAAWGRIPCEWTITFDRPYRLREIRMRLADGDKRFYAYAIATSVDGKNFALLEDRSAGGCRSWQQIKFSARPVLAVKIKGIGATSGDMFPVIEFEAYCVSPEGNRK